MKIQRGFKFRLKVSPEQQHVLWQQAGATRFVWNLFYRRQEYRRSRGFWVENFETQCRHLTQAKQHFTFLKAADSTVLQQKLKDLCRAYDDGFDPQQPNKRLPKPKKKHRCTNSFRYTQRVKIEGNRVYLPKLGWFRFHKSRDILGTLKNTTVSYAAGHWYVSFQTEYERAERPHQAHSLVGVDLGVKRLATLSNGWYVDGLDYLRKHQDKLARLQRQLAKKVKFSNNWRKIKQKISRLHTTIARCRRDCLHKFSNYLSKNHAMIVFEDLRVKNMSASAKGTVEEPGRNVRQKAGLNKAILDQGWAMLVEFCQYKQAWKNGDVLLVPAPGTSQACADCGHEHPDNRVEQAVFLCQSCGAQHNADDNASWNIEAAGHAVLACGAAGLPAAWKQEPSVRVTAHPLLIN